jgi:hypothetical protein
MWQVDNDRYQIWRLEHELAPRKMDRLLNIVTESDRSESWRLLQSLRQSIMNAVRGLFNLVGALPAALHLARREPTFGGEKAAGGQGTSL